MLMRNDFYEMKKNNEKISMVTAYDYPSAKIAQAAETEMILVGDSLGMVVLGYPSTIQVTMEDMIHHAKAARRGAPDTFLVVDMPFMSYHASEEEGLRNAAKLFQETGAQAVKLEGGSSETVSLIRKLTNGGIPVVIHLGLTPQSVNVFGGYKVQGRTEESAARILREALDAERAGAIALVLECIPESLAKEITDKVDIPTIGIGSGRFCDGQVLVYHDLLQYGVERLPKFAKAYADIDNVTKTAIETYIKEVKEGNFPKVEHSYL